MITSPRTVDLSLLPLDNARLQNLCGALDENLRQIEAAFDVTIAGAASIAASAASRRRRGWPASALQHFYERANRPLSIDEIQLGSGRNRPQPG